MKINDVIYTEQIKSSYDHGHKQKNKTTKNPPVTSWKPSHHFDMDLTIKSNGEWWHEGVRITRQKLINVFASILYCEVHEQEAQYFLQTPVEKARIHVEDVPLMVTSVEQYCEGGLTWLRLSTSTGDIITVNDKHPIVMNSFTGTDGKLQVRPYVHVRDQLYAFISRSTFYHLIEYGELIEENNTILLLLSSGPFSYKLSTDM